MRLINADDIRYDQLLNTGNKEHPLEWAVSRPVIDAMPTIEAEPIKHGHWINERGVIGWTCSNCHGHMVLHVYLNGNYCPNCGAIMDGEIVDLTREE